MIEGNERGQFDHLIEYIDESVETVGKMVKKLKGKVNEQDAELQNQIHQVTDKLSGLDDRLVVQHRCMVGNGGLIERLHALESLTGNATYNNGAIMDIAAMVPDLANRIASMETEDNKGCIRQLQGMVAQLQGQVLGLQRMSHKHEQSVEVDERKQTFYSEIPVNILSALTLRMAQEAQAYQEKIESHYQISEKSRLKILHSLAAQSTELYDLFGWFHEHHFEGEISE